MTPPVCANWCGTEGHGEGKYCPPGKCWLGKGKRRVRPHRHWCSFACRAAGRPVNPAPVEPTKDDGK